MQRYIVLEERPPKADLPGGRAPGDVGLRTASQTKLTTAVRLVSEEEEAPEHAVVCRRCGQPISSSRHRFSFRASSSIQVFPNPQGMMMKICTFRAAHDLALRSVPTDAFTWFEGYAWTVAVCGRCEEHLGWRYDAVGGSVPARFYGFLVDRVRDGGAAL